ncbi:MAG: hypothetical protein IIU00_00910 [Clostridia bacterium]|nr:hypothetical protein [Clostridia bacterium]
MLNIGDTVVFGTEGIFVIEQTTQQVVCGQKTDYYVLRSTNKDSSTVYLPMNNPALLQRARPLITEEEIGDLLSDAAHTEIHWVDDHKARKERFNEILQSGDRKGILALAGTLYHKQQAQLAVHKKLNSSDERILREAEKIINAEVAFVLHITPDEAKAYVRDHIGAARGSSSAGAAE